MGDYFDDDDLINDYMEEDFEPPSDYDDEFVVEEPDIACSADKKQEEDPMDVDPPQDDAEDNDKNKQGVPTAVHVTIPRPNTDVYSFERYVNLFHLEWRRGVRCLVCMSLRIGTLCFLPGTKETGGPRQRHLPTRLLPRSGSASATRGPHSGKKPRHSCWMHDRVRLRLRMHSSWSFGNRFAIQSTSYPNRRACTCFLLREKRAYP